MHTRAWCSVTMIPLAAMGCLVQTSFAAQRYTHTPNSGWFLWMAVATMAAFAVPFLLLARTGHPEPVFWCCAAITLAFPYDPLLVLMSMAALLARRSDRSRTIRTVSVATVVSIWAQLRDALQPADASLWHVVFAKSNTGIDESPVETITGEGTIAATAVVVALIEVTIAALVGLHIRSRASLNSAQARVDAATTHAATLQNDLNDQQLADAIAAEAHDTLAHSLSLLALNASALQAEASKLGDSPIAEELSGKADDIRRQAAGALDEAHTIIDMLRHPSTARRQLAPTDETALTRESLDTLIGETRSAGMTVNTWIDIQQLSALDDDVAKAAYRAIQEGLTNARRHAASAPVSLELTANPGDGVHVHISNPTTGKPVADANHVNDNADNSPLACAKPSPCDIDAQVTTATAHHDGSGLPGLLARSQAVGGECQYGLDARRIFHLDVRLPWHPKSNRARS